MKFSSRLLKWQLFRFIIVGVSNAVINFLILNTAFYYLHFSKIYSGILATACAMTFSFILNRHYVFGARGQRFFKQALPFVIVTMIGSFLILNLVYYLSIRLIAPYEGWVVNTVNSLSDIKLSESFVSINISTVIGAVAAMICNYNGYRIFVFKKEDQANVEEPEA